MQRGLALLAISTVALLASSADATIYASGDSSIFEDFSNANNFTPLAANQRFLLNIAGNNVLIQSSDLTGKNVGTGMSTFLTNAGISNSVVASSAHITAADLAGRSLFVGFLPSDNYTSGEIAALSDFLANGGSAIFTGETDDFGLFAVPNIAVLTVLNALGSAVHLNLDGVEPGIHTATIATNNADTAGTTGLQYAFTTTVSGGTPLYNTNGFGAFVAADYTPRGMVPEPASWAMMIAGFGLIGGALRRRRATVRFV